MNISIIGCGQIGFRHFQSILELKNNHHIFLIDKSLSSINKCKEYFESIKKRKKIVSFHTDIESITEKLEIVIIATNSFQRREEIEKVLKLHNPKHIILEKFLFPKLSDYKYCDDLFDSHVAKVWVNQWMGFEFKELKNFINPSKNISFNVKGNNWGLCCNSVHYIDWFHSIIDREEIFLDTIDLEKKIYCSKRANYYEIFGKYKIKSNSGHTLTLECNKNADLNDLSRKIFIEISNSDNSIFTELLEDSLICNIENDDEVSQLELPVRFQSKRTSEVIQSLIDSDHCNLIEYRISSGHHLIIFKMIEDIFKLNKFDLTKGIPIT